MSQFGLNSSVHSFKWAVSSRQIALLRGKAASPSAQTRASHDCAFDRLSRIFVPTGGIATSNATKDDRHSLLVRAGFLRRAHAGIFHLLPLGLRVQESIEQLIDKHMQRLGANKVSLSSITSKKLWEKSGRFSKTNTELYQLNDGSDTGLLLSPTHEEEITTIIAEAIDSYKQLPLRLYQTSRKYRNERRPRQGLLRAREFLMKDLYTFDLDEAAALQTYSQVKSAYNDFFSELKVPYLVAEADSGAMGGNLSHEFHLASAFGEDTVFSCNSCSYVANEELVDHARETEKSIEEGMENVVVRKCMTYDKEAIVAAFYPSSHAMDSVNMYAVKRVAPEADFTIEKESETWENAIKSGGHAPNIIALVDYRLSDAQKLTIFDHVHSGTFTVSKPTTTHYVVAEPISALDLDLLKVRDGDRCPRCGDGFLHSQQAVELGHTFYLGTRYSIPLSASVSHPDSASLVPLSMGCHGIGVSRLIGTIATALADDKGLNWPRAISPYDVVVAHKKELGDAAEQVASALCDGVGAASSSRLRVLLDDRDESLGWKLNDADLMGFPIIVVVGRSWHPNRYCEVQCRRLDGFKKQVKLEDLPGEVMRLVDNL